MLIVQNKIKHDHIDIYIKMNKYKFIYNYE